MNKIEKILAEIEKLTKNVEFEHEAGYNDALCDVKVIINTLPEEPVSEDLEKAAEKYAYTNWEDEDYHEGAAEGLPFDAIGHTEKAFKAGAQWKEQQFEKNRIAACDRQTKEEADREMDFVQGIIKNEHRQPTYSDAIEYGMRLKEQQMMEKAIKWLRKNWREYVNVDVDGVVCFGHWESDFRKAMSNNKDE